MSRFLAVMFLLIGMQAPAQNIAPPGAGKLVYENWMAASFDGIRAGYVHDSVVEHNVNNAKILRASRRLLLSVRRFGDLAVIEAVTGSDETPDGKVLGTFMQQQISKKSVLTVRGVVKGNQLHTTAEGQAKFDKHIPWDPSVVGTWGELQLVGQKKPQPGTEFEYLMYEPTVNSMVKVQAKTEAYERVQIGNENPLLLRVRAQPQPIAGIVLPASSFWYDQTYQLIKSETIMPGLGHLVLMRTSRADATQPAQGPDLGWRQSITLNQRLNSPLEDTSITYRIKLKDEKPGELFSHGDRQTVKILGNGVVELVIKSTSAPTVPPKAGATSPGNEFVERNNFITSDDAKVKEHAAAAVGAETNPWRKAQLIERWVHQNMKAMNFTEAMAPASEVAKSLNGDCTEFAMLTAAMCRAAGVPSRTALGLVYVDIRDNRPPMLAMHMWSEVWINDQWVGLDATLGRGGIGPTHIKITDHSWHNVVTLTPLFPLMRFNMASPTVEIVGEQRIAP